MQDPGAFTTWLIPCKRLTISPVGTSSCIDFGAFTFFLSGGSYVGIDWKCGIADEDVSSFLFTAARKKGKDGCLMTGV